MQPGVVGQSWHGSKQLHHGALHCRGRRVLHGAVGGISHGHVELVQWIRRRHGVAIFADGSLLGVSVLRYVKDA